MTIGARIKKLRERLGYSQKQLADKVGLNISVFNRIEQDTRPIRSEELTKVAEILEVSTDYLSGKTNIPSMKLDQTQRKIIDNIDLSDDDLVSFPMSVGDRELTVEEKMRVIRTIRALLDVEKQ